MHKLVLVLLICLVLFFGCPEENKFNSNPFNQKNIEYEVQNAVADVNFEEFSDDPVDVNFNYVLRGKHFILTSRFYGGLNDYLQSLPRTITYREGEVIGDINFVQKFIDEPYQEKYLEHLAEYIKSLDVPEDDKVRIIVSLVQNIPYDETAYNNAVNGQTNIEKFPYQVLFLNKGICGEKSRVIIFFLRELGFGTAYINFEEENHAVPGIKCPVQFSYKNSGYCFIESTAPAIITYSEGTYIGAGKLESTPKITVVNQGKSFDSVSMEFNDALLYKKLLEDHSGDNYSVWLSLRSKYGLEQSSCPENAVLCNGECWTGNCSGGTFQCTNQGLICYVEKYV